MMRGRQIDKCQASEGARRAWMSGLLVWSFVLQLLVPVLGPVRFGDGTAMAALGRIMPICTIEGLRLAEPATGNGIDTKDAAPIDAGWHCILCVVPATGPAEVTGNPAPPTEWRFSWTSPPTDPPAADRPRSPQSARGPPQHS